MADLTLVTLYVIYIISMYYIITVQCALIFSIGLRSVCLQVCHETFNILLGGIKIIDLRSWFDLKKLIIYNFVCLL